MYIQTFVNKGYVWAYWLPLKWRSLEITLLLGDPNLLNYIKTAKTCFSFSVNAFGQVARTKQTQGQ